nr:immunoglobulin heavy chain junction region [Mus musculus]
CARHEDPYYGSSYLDYW